MKMKKSMLSILGVLLLSLSFVSSAGAVDPNPVLKGDGGGSSKTPPTKCGAITPCPLP
ncbi:hypothetical protein [Psychrobacillus glaciei]|uniref:hypothetical protein n=1 Tax=Psychrobacillus glaciei TaxID=2283160 RepID=UPI00178C3C8A|nr:hypothetical protein [Psychrobacillus glaciei]